MLWRVNCVREMRHGLENKIPHELYLRSVQADETLTVVNTMLCVVIGWR